MRLKGCYLFLAIIVTLISISSFVAADCASNNDCTATVCGDSLVATCDSNSQCSCESQNGNIPQTCSDSDGGKNYTSATSADSCANQTTVREFFCNSLIIGAYENYSCLNLGNDYRCEAGKCINTTPPITPPPTTFTGNICNITTRASCSANNIVLGLSSLNNSHAQISTIVSGTTQYPYVLCCQGSIVDQSCSSNNSILRLSSPTNAHVEKGSSNIYQNKICLKDQICSTKATCSSGEEAILSLSSELNAHLSIPNGAGAYALKLCCKSGTATTGATWKNMIDVQITTADLNDLVKLSVSGEGLQGKEIEYQIYRTVPFWFDKKMGQFSSRGFTTWRAGSDNSTGTTILTAGTYYFKARLRESDEWKTSGALEVSNVSLNNPPIATIFSPSTGNIFGAGINILFSSNGSYDVDDEITTEWFELNSATPTTAISDDSEFLKSYSQGNEGQKNVELIVTDSRNSIATDKVSILIVKEGRNLFGIIESPEDGAIDVNNGNTVEQRFSATTFAIDCFTSQTSCQAASYTDCNNNTNYPILWCGGKNDPALQNQINLNWTVYNLVTDENDQRVEELLFALAGKNTIQISETDKEAAGISRGIYNEFWRNMINGEYTVKLKASIQE